MKESELSAYGPILLQFLIALGLAGVIVILSTLVGRHRSSRAKNQPYECGVLPVGDARQPFSVQFYLVGMVFILFDIEAIFLYPWALVYHDLRWFGFVEMLLYIAILLVGYLYLWKQRALDWYR